MLSNIVNLQRLNLRSLRFIVETIKSFTRGLVHHICPARQTLSIPKCGLSLFCFQKYKSYRWKAIVLNGIRNSDLSVLLFHNLIFNLIKKCALLQGFHRNSGFWFSNRNYSDFFHFTRCFFSVYGIGNCKYPGIPLYGKLYRIL